MYMYITVILNEESKLYRAYLGNDDLPHSENSKRELGESIRKLSTHLKDTYTEGIKITDIRSVPNRSEWKMRL